MKPNILLLVLSLSLCILLACGGGGGNSSDGLTEDNQENEDTIENNDNNANSSQASFIQLLDENYTLKQVSESEIGLMGQIALLPTGEIVVADANHNRILIVSGGKIKIVANENNINGWVVCPLPDGRICYSLMDGQLYFVNPENEMKEYFNSTPDGARVTALASDEFGNVYAATTNLEIYRFGADGFPNKIAENLPYDVEWAINDLDIDENGKIYAAGYNRVVRINQDESFETIVDNLNYEPVWIEVAIDGNIYINDVASGLQKYDPTSGHLEEFKLDNFASPFGDILSPAYSEIIFRDNNAFYNHNFSTNITNILLTVTGILHVFAANSNDTVFYSIQGSQLSLDSHMVSLTIDGVKTDLFDLTYSLINCADVDKKNRLCLATSDGFKRVESDNTVTTVLPTFESDKYPWHKNGIAVGPNDTWYVIESDYDSLIQVFKFDDFGTGEVLPITFNKALFGDVYKLNNVNIDVGDDGRIAIVVTALGTPGQGPFYQRVFTAGPDGSNLKEVCNLDSNRIAGMVDIAVAQNNDIFVLCVQEGSDSVYRIDHQSFNAIEFIRCESGHDPASIDVDSSGKVYIATTSGIYVAEPKILTNTN